MSKLEKTVFIVGSGRSGTTWLQTLLAQHPQIASAPETDLFAGYLALLEQRWQFELERRKKYRLTTGLSNIIGERGFHDFMFQLSYGVLEGILRTKPGAIIVLEKTPHNARYASLILQVLPQSIFIHLVRDPRAVCASMMAAAQNWGAYWAPRGAATAALLWRELVEAGFNIRKLTNNYIQIHYESLIDKPTETVGKLFEWLGLRVSPEVCAAYVEACRIERLQKGDGAGFSPTKTTKSFFRKGSKDSWRTELNKNQIRTIEYVAGEVMDRAGYQREYSVQQYPPIRVVSHKLLKGVEWRTRAMFEYLTNRL